MGGIGLSRFKAVEIDQKVGFAGRDQTELRTRPAEKGFFGKVVGWLQNQSAAHLTEKRQVMGSFLLALRQEYGSRVADEAFTHAIGQDTSRSLRGTQIKAAIDRADVAAVDRFLSDLNRVHAGSAMDVSFSNIFADLGVDLPRLGRDELARLAETMATRIAAKTLPGERLSWEQLKAEARMAIQTFPRVRAELQLAHSLASAARFAEGRDPAPIKRAFADFASSPGFTSLPPQTRDAIMTKLADKLAYVDIEVGAALRLDRPAEFRHTLDLIAFEVMSPAQIRTRLAGMTEADLVGLVDHAFGKGRNTPYGEQREGGWAMTTVLGRMASEHRDEAPVFEHLSVENGPRLRELLQGLESGRFDPSQLRPLRSAEADLGAILEDMEARAVSHTERFAEDFAGKTEQLVGKLDARLLALHEQGRDDEPLVRDLRALRVELASLSAAMPDAAAFTAFTRVFGFRFEETPAFESLTGRQSDPDKDLLRVAQAFTQVGVQLRSHANPDVTAELAALGRMVIALPTAEKSLADMSYLPSLVQDLSGTLSRLSARGGAEHRLAEHPILVFDQSSPAKLEANRDFIRGLNERTGANIVQVSMAEVDALATKLGLRELFATTPEGRAGFGGARNMSFLLAPMLHKAMRDEGAGVASMADLVAKPTAYLEGLMRDVLNGTGHEMVLMGDDDTTVQPGFMDAKMQLAVRYEDDYAKITTLTLGRATTRIPPVLDPAMIKGIAFHEDAIITGVDQLQDTVTGAMRGTQWEGERNKAVEHQMAGALMHPGSCLDLPLPSEEGQVANYQHEVVDWLGTALHHPGDRFARVETRLDQLASYYNQAKLAQDLLGVIDKPFSNVLPWNDPSRSFDNIGGIYEHASDPATQLGIRRAFMDRLVDMPVNTELLNVEGAFGVLEERDRQRLADDPVLADRVSQVKAAFVRAKESYAIAMEFRERLVGNLIAAFQELPPSEAKQGIVDRLGADPTGKAARKEALGYLLAHGEGALTGVLRDAVDDAATSTPDFARSDIARSMRLVATSTLFRFGELSARLAEIKGE